MYFSTVIESAQNKSRLVSSGSILPILLYYILYDNLFDKTISQTLSNDLSRFFSDPTDYICAICYIFGAIM